MIGTVEERARQLRDSRKTLYLATVGADGTPTASYAPFIGFGPYFYIYISELSRHTKDLRNTRKASVLLIESEDSAANLFARRRITFSCDVFIMCRTSSAWHDIMDSFEKKFGSMFGPVCPLKDFVLFNLTAYEAIYVEEFGHAYRMKPDLSAAEHIGGIGHRTK